MGGPSFQERRRSNYPIGVLVRVRLISGREVEAQIVKTRLLRWALSCTSSLARKWRTLPLGKWSGIMTFAR
jgi:hypothetical protein